MSQWAVDENSKVAVQCSVKVKVYLSQQSLKMYRYATCDDIITLKTTVPMQVQISQHVETSTNKI